MLRLILILFICFYMTGISFAETVYLKSGETVEGEIVERTDKYIKGYFYGVELTYWLDDIERIEDNNRKQSEFSSSSNSISNDKNTYYSKKFGLEVKAPEGWTVIDSSNPEKLREETGGLASGIICIFKEDSSGSSPLIYIKNDLQPSGYTIEDYTEFLKGQNIKRKETVSQLDILEDPHIINVNGNKFIKTVTRFNGPSGLEVYVYYHFLNGMMRYTIMVSCPAVKFDVYKDIFDKTARSLIFKGISSDALELADAEQLMTVGSQYFSGRQFDKAIEYHKKALNKAVDTELKTSILTMLSSSYLEKGIIQYLKDKDDTDYNKAIGYAEQALKIKPTYWYALGNIAVVYMNMGDLDKADFYYNEAEKYAQTTDPGYQELIMNHGLIKEILEARMNKENSGK